MKKKLFIILQIFILLLTLTGCQPEKKVVDAINGIGNVSLGSLEMIEYAEALYNALNIEDKVKVTNKNTLDRARAEYNRQEAIVTDTIEQISDIGEVTIGSEKIIKAARESFDAAIDYDVVGKLTASEKILKTAEEKLITLKKEAEDLLTDAQELCDKGKYQEAEQLIAGSIDMFRELGTAEPYGTLAVKALCQYSQNEYNNGRYMNAMNAVMNAMVYEDCCEPSTYTLISKQISNYANGMHKFKPKNEEVLDRTQPAGANTLKVYAGDYDTVVKLELLDNPTKYVTVFVEARKSATIYMHNGEYRIKYTCGPLWIDETNMFGDFSTFVELPETITMAGFTITKNKVTTQRRGSATATLADGYGNNYPYQNMDPNMF